MLLGSCAARWAATLLLLLWTYEGGVGAGTGVACPYGFYTAQAWCATTFGRGGTLTIGNWDPFHFECVCNGRSSIDVTVTVVPPPATDLICTWSDTFESFPDGEYCYSTTSVCPIDCADISEEICDTTLSSCRTTGDVYNYSCTTCAGQLFTIDGTASECTKHITQDDLRCTPAQTCNGHGCCARPRAGESGQQATCSCFRDASAGHWTGPNCDRCAEGFEPGGNPGCTTPTPKIQVILSSIAQSWTMVLPNLAVLFLFVVLGLARRLWDSDTDYELTRLRRANLSRAQIARRHQQSLFHTKYIPARPASSRSFANTAPQQSRGPPAY